MDNVKLCRDCKHYEPVKRECHAPGNMAQNYEIGGMRAQQSVMFQRNSDDKRDCGPNGKWWEAK